MGLDTDIRLEVLLREGKRTRATIRSVARALEALGVEIALEGSSVISVRVPASMKDAFLDMARREKLLDPEAENTLYSPKAADEVLAPKVLTENVEMITVPMRHLKF